MPPLLDIKGQKFGRLTVIERVHVPNARNAMWRCLCECGEYSIAAGPNIGRTTFSCGCWVRESNSRLNKTHGMTKSSEFGIWAGMKQRCTNPNDFNWSNYGGRGITVCERWRHSFENFYADLGPRPSKKHSLDRIDQNGHYEKSNCRWATIAVQNRNTRRTNLVEIDGINLCILDWCSVLGVKREDVYESARSKASLSEGGSTREFAKEIIRSLVSLRKNVPIG